MWTNKVLFTSCRDLDANPNEEAPLKYYCFGHRFEIFRTNGDKSALDWKPSAGPLLRKVRQPQILCPTRSKCTTCGRFSFPKTVYMFSIIFILKYSHSHEILFLKGYLFAKCWATCVLFLANNFGLNKCKS